MTANLNIHLDLRYISSVLNNIVFNPSRFSAAVFKSHRFRSTCLIFRTGRLVCVGAKSIDESRRNVRRFARILQKKCNCSPRVTDLKVQSITCVYRSGARLNLTEIARQNDWNYDVEIFPMIQLRTCSNLHIAISHKGCYIITGVTNLQKAQTDLEDVLLRVAIS